MVLSRVNPIPSLAIGTKTLLRVAYSFDGDSISYALFNMTAHADVMPKTNHNAILFAFLGTSQT